MRRTIPTWIFGVAITAIMLIGNLWHVITQWFTNKPEQVFTGIAHFHTDYFLYVSQIAQGARGAVLWSEHLFTNESLSPTWIYWFNILLGNLGGLIGFSPFFIYTFFLAFLAFLALLVWYRIIQRMFPRELLLQTIAFLFVATSSGFAAVGDFWFSPTPALNRLGGVPHQVFQTILLLLVVLYFVDGMSSKFRLTIGRIGVLVGLSFLAATANPIQMILVVLAGAITLLLMKPRSYRVAFSLLLAVSIPALFGAWLTNAEFARQPILLAAKAWENSQQIHVSLWQFILAVGPIALLMPFGVKPFLSLKTPFVTMFFLFGILSLIIFFSPIPVFLGTASVRWLSPASYGVFPILGALGLIEVSQFLYRTAKKTIPLSLVRYSLLALYLIFTVPSLLVQVNARTMPLQTDPTLIALNHVPQDTMEVLTFMKTSKNQGVVLTDPHVPYDILVPVMTGLTSFTGHPLHTLFPQQKESLRQEFFSGAMSPAQVRQFLIDHRIGFILISPNTTLSPYSFVQKQFENTLLVVYKTTMQQ